MCECVCVSGRGIDCTFFWKINLIRSWFDRCNKWSRWRTGGSWRRASNKFNACVNVWDRKTYCRICHDMRWASRPPVETYKRQANTAASTERLRRHQQLSIHRQVRTWAEPKSLLHIIFIEYEYEWKKKKRKRKWTLPCGHTMKSTSIDARLSRTHMHNSTWGRFDGIKEISWELCSVRDSDNSNYDYI